jgi:hypothetical protein
MTQRFTTGQAFAQGDQVTAQKLEDIVEKATPLTALTDDTSTTVSGGQIIVKTATGAANGITLPKIAHQPANTVLVRDANSEGEVSAKAVTDTQILIGDGTGFTAAALSGDVTMTNGGAVTIANNAVEGSMILSSTTLQDGVKCADQSASDNSTKIANTKYVDAQVSAAAFPKYAVYNGTDVSSSQASDIFITLTENTDLFNIGTLSTVTSSNDTVTIGSGKFLITYHFKAQELGGTGDHYDADILHNGSAITGTAIEIDSASNLFYQSTQIFVDGSAGSNTFRIHFDENGSARINITNLVLIICKIA